MLAFIYPSDYFNPQKVDEEYFEEYEAAKKHGFPVFVFDEEQFKDNGNIKLHPVPNSSVQAFYRGWMLKPELYQLFYDSLLTKGVELFTKSDEYSRFHSFPNIYKDIEPYTAKTVYFEEDDRIDVDLINKSFEKFMVKDFVKSVKGARDFPTFFETPVQEKYFLQLLEKFRDYRGDQFTGGYVIKEYLKLQPKSEFRAFYLNGELLSLLPQDNSIMEPPLEFANSFKDLSKGFYTIDFGMCLSGEWKIIESGDGQVSGLPDGCDVERFYEGIKIKSYT